MKLSDLRTDRTVVVNCVDFLFKKIKVSLVPIYGIEFEGSISRYAEESPKYIAEYWGHAKFDGRLFEVHCYVPVDSFEEAIAVDNKTLMYAEWEQERSFSGWKQELIDLFQRWRSFAAGEEFEE